ncbi:MAG: hypothetical protein OHK0019_35610 [Saprospiraceae bacterium]
MALWLFACNKSEERPTIIHGRVTEYGTGAPIEEARIYVLCQEGTVLGPSSFTLIDSILTDMEGKFYREYAEGELCGSVSFLPYKAGYFKGNEFYYTTDNKFFDVVLDPISWFKVITVPDILGDRIYFTGTFTGASGWDTWKGDGTKSWLFETRGNRDAWIAWDYYGGGVNSHRDTVYLPKHDTTTYTIHY